MKTIKYIIILSAIFAINSYATKLTPESRGAYSSGTKLVNSTIYFTGSGSYDQDSQNGGVTPQWQWDFDYNGTFTPDITTTDYMVRTAGYSIPRTYTVAVKYMDNDGQWGSVVTFTIIINQVKKFYYVKDHLGNIRQTLNETGGIAAAQDYYPYGEVLRGYNQSLVNEKYKFSEKERDIETNFDNFGGRLYDGALAIWLRPDPIGFLVSPGISPYAYCYNNPLKYIDPIGLDTIDATDDSKTPKRGDYIKGPDGSVTYNSTSDVSKTADNTNPILTYVNYGNTIGGTAASITKEAIQYNNLWLGRNGKYYPLSWGGNQYTGARSSVVRVSEQLKTVGKVSLFIGLGFNGADMMNAYSKNNWSGMALAGVDAGFTLVGYYGGFPGAGISVVWFGGRWAFSEYGVPLQTKPIETNCHYTPTVQIK